MSCRRFGIRTVTFFLDKYQKNLKRKLSNCFYILCLIGSIPGSEVLNYHSKALLQFLNLTVSELVLISACLNTSSYFEITELADGEGVLGGTMKGHQWTECAWLIPSEFLGKAKSKPRSLSLDLRSKQASTKDIAN